MQVIPLYRYNRPAGGTTVSPVKPPDGTEYESCFRIVADEGMMLVNGDVQTACADVDSLDGWQEIQMIEEQIEQK